VSTLRPLAKSPGGTLSSDVGLVGRDRELAIVDSTLASISEHGSSAIIRGEPGIGKSAVLVETGRRAAVRGIRVLKTAGSQAEANLPFAGLHQLLRPVLGGLDSLPAAHRQALRAAFGLVDVAAPDIFRIALAALELIAESAAQAPLLLIAEDAHWLDRATVDVLAFVARRLHSDPIVLVIAIRDGYESVLEDVGSVELRLERLDDTNAARLLDAHAPDLSTALRGRLLAEAAGNPLALVELPIAARDLESSLTVGIRLPLTTRLEQAFAMRASELPNRTRTLLLVAAINDSDAVGETLAAAAILDDAVTINDFTPAASAGLIGIDDTTVRFRHPLVASSIHHEAPVAQRLAAHAALAAVLGDQSDRQLWHHAASSVGPDEEIAGQLEEAASRAERRGALGAAATGLERAARLTTHGKQGPRLLRAATLALELGKRDNVERLIREAKLLELSPLDLARLAWIVETLDPGITGDREDVLPLILAAESAADHGDPDLALSLLSAAAANSFWANRDEAHDEILSATERVGVRPNDPRLLSILAYAALPDEVAMVIERVARWPADRSHDALSMQLLGTAAFSLGFHSLAGRFLTASIDTMRDQGRLVQLAQSLVMRAWSEINLGRWTVAAPDAEEGARLAHETAQPIWEAGAHVAQAFLLGMRGDERAAEELVAQAEKVVVPAGGRAVVAVVQLTRAMTALAYGRYDDAYSELQRMLDPADLAHHRMNFYWAVANLAEAAVPLGRIREVRAIVEQLEPRAAQTPSPVFQQAMRHGHALLANDDTAEGLFRAALDGDLVGGPFERARLQVAYGVWLRRQRRVAESREPLRAARDSFDALGAVVWSERARQELRAAGESSRQREPGLLEKLSAQELQVAQMAADGLSNREIGQKLYLSHRTVGSHLYRTYPKLGITARAQLRWVIGLTAPTRSAA